jgi:hypothetical protein
VHRRLPILRWDVYRRDERHVREHHERSRSEQRVSRLGDLQWERGVHGRSERELMYGRQSMRERQLPRA